MICPNNLAMSKRIAVLIVAASLLRVGAARAGTLEDGQAAYDRGDYATALRLWRPLAQQGDDYAQLKLGFMYGTGQGVAQDYAKALKWYRLAAQQGEANAQYGLGMMYARGDGVAQDYTEAAKWFRLDAQQGHAKA